MEKLDAALVNWTRSYAQLKEAQSKLDAQREIPGADVSTLAAEVERLQIESEALLAEVQDEFVLMRKRSAK